ncbi:MAG: NAD(P)-dependent alcohol dehydrogenase [Archangium sp.]|nr:NAD(P)-dependent alcohol dehydrogenase [Archangium sp.]
MRAAVYERYGAPEVVLVKEVAKPAPKDDEVLIRVRATTVTAADWRARSLNAPLGFGFMMRLVFGVTGPRKTILGTELAGDVEAVGAKVTEFKPGDAVFAYCGAHFGAHAEYICLPANSAIALKPASLGYDEAAALSFGGVTAIDFLGRAELKPGERVVVNGASGAVGSAAVQLAKHQGAHVTGVCSGANVELVRSLGADEVIDYTQRDFTEATAAYDVILDAAGTAPFSRCGKSLKEGGRLLLVLGALPDMLHGAWAGFTSSKRVFSGPSGESAEDLKRLAELATSGAYKPLIEQRYPLERIVDAHRLVDSGRKKGNVVVTT